MTQTLRTSRRTYQRSPAAGGDGNLTNALARLRNNDGSFDLTSETTRTRLYDTVNTPFSPAADFLGRVVTLRTTPAAPGASSGVRKVDNWTFIITAVDGGGTWVELEGFRAEDAGTGIDYTVHASVDMAAASAAFSVDEGPLGPNAAPYPAQRTNQGPTVGQVIFFTTTTDQALRSQPWMISALGPGATATATNARLSDTFDRLDTIPTATSLEWALRDYPVYTFEQLFKVMHRFILSCGWTLEQFRGANSGVGLHRFIPQDVVYRSTGEAGDKLGFLRAITFNNGTGTTGGFSADATSRMGIDFALFGAWDRDFSNGANYNPGNGVSGVRAANATTNTFAAGPGADNTSNSQPPFWSPDMQTGTLLPEFYNWGSPQHSTVANQNLRPNSMNTPEGGEILQLHYTFFGDADEIQMIVEAQGYGSAYVGLGFLTPRADANEQIHTTNYPISNGSNIAVRVGGVPGNANSDGVNPEVPGGSIKPLQAGDVVQIAGTTVNPGLVGGGASPATRSHAGEFIESTTIVSFPGLLPAIGTINMVAGASLSDGGTVTINDNEGQTTVFEMDLNSGGVGGGNVAVGYTAADSANTVATTLAGIITSDAVNITAIAVGSQVQLTHGTAGGVGNLGMVLDSTIIADGVTSVGMSGGGYSIQVAQLNGDYSSGALVGEDPQPLFFYRVPHNSASQQFTTAGGFRVNNRVGAADPTYFDGAPPAPASGLGFDCYAEIQGVSTLAESNPNQRGGRFVLLPVMCRDQDGGQLRGVMKGMRYTSPRIREYQLVPDVNGDYHFLVPSPHMITSAQTSELGSNPVPLMMAFGPIPAAHAL